jgi:hypothetical protein
MVAKKRQGQRAVAAGNKKQTCSQTRPGFYLCFHGFTVENREDAVVGRASASESSNNGKEFSHMQEILRERGEAVK